MGLGLGLGESTHRAFIGLSRCQVHVEPSVAPPERQGVSWYSGLASRPEVYSCGLKISMCSLLAQLSTKSSFELPAGYN